MPMTVPWWSWAIGIGQKFGFWVATTPKSLKKSRAARAKTTSWTINIAISTWISITDEKSEDPAKMTHSISVLTLVDTV